MKYIIFILITLIAVSLYADFYTDYIDSLEIAFSEQQIERMLNLSNVIIEYDSARAEGYYYKAYAYYLSDIYNNADDIINMSLEREKNEENTYLKLLISRKLNAQDYSSMLNEAYADFPMDYRIWDLKSSLFYSNSMPDSSLFYALSVIKRIPSHENSLYRASVILYNKKAYSKAYDITAKLIQYHSKSMYKLLMGKIYLKLGKYNAASDIFSILSKTDMVYSGLKYLSYTQYESGNLDSCIHVLYHMRQIFPDSLYPIDNLAAMLSLTGNNDIADTLYSHFEEITLLGNRVMGVIADAYFKHDMYDKAGYYYNEIMNDTSFLSKSAVQAFFYTQQYSRSLDMLSRYHSEEDTSLAVFINSYKGNNYFSLGNYLEAEIHYNNALMLDPSDTVLMFNLANTYYMNRKDALLQEMIDSISIAKPEFGHHLKNTFIPQEEDSLTEE